MKDREMLELVAKAAGITGTWHRSGYVVYSGWSKGIFDPRNDDGDALRLAVRLDMHIALFGGAMESRVLADGDDWKVEGWECGKDAATRLAITRAAAEIGKEMK